MLDFLPTSPLLISLSLTLLHFLWQGLLVAAVLKSTLLIFNQHRPQVRYALSALAMSANLLLPLVTFVIIYQTESASTNTIVSSLALTEFIQELKQPDVLLSYKAFATFLPLLLPYLAILWLTTTLLLAGKLLIEIYNINNLPKQAVVAPNQQLQARFNELAEQIKLTIAPRLLISLKIDVPMAIGWLKPVVLLPANMVSGLSTPQLEMLLLHELAHIRRHDYLVNFFQTLVEILLFFHPSVHWVSKQMRNEREYCSDDIAVQHCGDAVAYAHTLADTASLCTKNHRHTIPNMAMAASGGDLKQRVIRLVDHHCAPQNNISKWLASATIIFSVLALSSKQLLTMPLLDILPNDKAIKNTSNTAQASINTQLSDEIIPPSSIAQQLLTPQQDLTEQPESSPTLIPAEIKESLTTQVQQTLSLSKVIPAKSQFKALPLETTQSTLLSKAGTTTNFSKVEPVIQQTNSQNKRPLTANLSPQTKTVLTSPLVKAVQAKEIKANRRKTLSEVLADTSGVNETKNNLAYSAGKTNISEKFIDHFSRQKEEWVQPIAMVNKSIVPISPVWQSAEQVKSVDPIYPRLAKRKGIEIEVKVNFTIDVDGQIKDIKFAKHNRVNYFKKSIRTAIRKWRFLPAKVDEKPVESKMAKVFSFSLQS